MRPLPATLTKSAAKSETGKVVLDSFAWIEYFSGSLRGEKVRQFIEAGASMTPTIVIAEVSEKYARMKLDPEPRLVFITARSGTIVLDENLARTAGEVNYERKKTVKGWGLADSIILAAARRSNVKVVTGDQHFQDLLSETIMI